MPSRALILMFSLWFASPFQNAFSKQDDYAEGEVLITFKPGLEADGAKTALGKHALKLTRHYDGISRIQQRVCGLVTRQGQSTSKLIETLKADPSVETAEPNYYRRVSATPPNDTDFPKLWGLQNTGQTVNSTLGTNGVDASFLAAWKLARTSANEVVVGVVDTGVDITHPDLAANIWVNPGEIAGNGLDDDGNGYINDINGYDFAGNTATITDSSYHGTHVAGTIAAVGKNTLGVIGVQYRAKILPLKVSSDGENILTSDAIEAYNYAVNLRQHGVNIVALNASFSGTSFSTSERTAVEALRNAGIVLCAAAGNETTNNDATPSYPANYTTSNIISVAALTQNNGLASFSNYGATSVDLAAPGENIYSTVPLGAASTTTASVMVGSTTHAATGLEYSGTTTASGLTKAIYSCGIGNPADFPSSVNGNIALIQRGTLTFAEKVTNAKNAGAVAAIIYDNTSPTSGSWTLGSSGSWIPALQVSQAIGQAILALLPTSGTVINVPDTTSAYQFLNGTSMATPHVAGAVAFAALNHPSDTVSQRITRILGNVTPVTALSGKMTTGGRLNLLKIVDTDGDGLPDWWETENFGSLAQSAVGDPDADGFPNASEFLANTNPTQPGSHLSITSIAMSSDGSGNHFQLSFPTVADRLYQIEWSDSLENNSWQVLGATITGTGLPVQVEDTDAMSNSPKRFYRMRVLSD